MHPNPPAHPHGNPHDHSHGHSHSHDDHGVNAASSSSNSSGGSSSSNVRRDAEHAHALEQQLNEMVQQGRVLEAYMNDVMSRQAAVGRMLDDARIASATIQGLNAEAESEALVPVGVGIYIKTNVPAPKKLLVSLGSGVTVEKSRDDALNYVEARIKEYEVAMRQLDIQRQQIAMQLEQVQQQVNLMIRSAQSRSG